MILCCEHMARPKHMMQDSICVKLADNIKKLNSKSIFFDCHLRFQYGFFPQEDETLLALCLFLLLSSTVWGMWVEIIWPSVRILKVSNLI